MERTEADLIAAVLKGDASSFEPLVQKYSPRVFATARRYARRESEIEDIVQEVWLKAFQKLCSFRGEAPFEHWLMRLAVRTCYDFLRGHQRNRETCSPNSPKLKGTGWSVSSKTRSAPTKSRCRPATGESRPRTAFAPGAPGDHAPGNRGTIGKGNRAVNRLVCAIGKSPGLSGPGEMKKILAKIGKEKYL